MIKSHKLCRLKYMHTIKDKVLYDMVIYIFEGNIIICFFNGYSYEKKIFQYEYVQDEEILLRNIVITLDEIVEFIEEEQIAYIDKLIIITLSKHDFYEKNYIYRNLKQRNKTDIKFVNE